ncbi:hypothetical protein ESB00_10205 [Oleiharenicola lentus]|jgi:hypothetical protein|uniref:Aldose 1-epimerase n=1 Tax=Oleiharenicola lentus TaxID=2508720 RepID=A0A4Q1CB88_9BACT|nr:hypothetical protein [Oleiharenicola lentus]RXK56220.1 hypothetical protein ESB00_10205 [Oleiharenicola lentus]
MLTLANAELTVDLLDPAAEHARLGPRFCWGGYIWQVHDSSVGTLLTGPEWPEVKPQPHNGQGLPESFRHSTTTGQPLLWDGSIGLAPGAGALGRDEQGAVIVTEPCVWQVEPEPTRTVFRTAQTVGRWSYALERSIELRGRQLLSRSQLTNRGTAPLALEWFAHPFFALQSDGLLRAKLAPDVSLEDNPGYLLCDGALTLHCAFVGVHDGHLVHLGLPANQPFAVTLSHPKLTAVRFATDFAPLKCVLWANGNTLSFEPFLALVLAPGESRTWTLTYDFGPPSSGTASPSTSSRTPSAR